MATSALAQYRAKFGTTTKPKSSDIKTSSGLYQLAKRSGLQSQADRILAAQRGEDVNKIFSGGFITDVFDALSALQYGVVGTLKGKGFVEGVKTRQSFSDKDALGQYGLPGVVGGILLDIAVDPLTYLAPATVAKKIPGLVKAGRAIKAATFGKRVLKTVEGAGDVKNLTRLTETVEGGTKLGKYLAQKFVWAFGQDPIYRKTMERGALSTGKSVQKIVDLGRRFGNIAPETAAKILTKDKEGRFIRVPLAQVSKLLKPEELDTVTKLYKTIDDLGVEAADLGLINKGTVEENLGEYIKNAYKEYEATKKGVFGIKPKGIPKIFKRKEVADVAEFGLTQVDNPQYLLMKSAIDLTRSVENAKVLREVGAKFGSDVAQEGFSKVPTGAKWGALAGKYIPDHMANDLLEMIEPAKDTVAKQLVAGFKFSKVILNPATHVRNVVSNQILNWWKLGMNPLDPRTISAQKEALSEISKGAGKWIDEATEVGYNLDTFASQELKALLNSDSAVSVVDKLGVKGKKIAQKLGEVYQGEENFAKLTAYIFSRKNRGLGVEEAWKAAESATFNYAQVTPFVRKLRESLFGFPFITFAVKSTPLAVETALKNPRRISAFGKIKAGIENLSDKEETARERAAEPSWVRDGFYIKLPIKDKQGNSAYFDMTYILPMGDLLTGSFFERSVDRETGLPEGGISGAAKKSPFINLVTEVGKNQDFYGNKIWKDSDPMEKQFADLMRHLTKTYAPPLIADQIPGGYDYKGDRTQRGIIGAVQRGKDERQDQQRTLMEELLRMVGAKVQPINADVQEMYQEWNTKRGLESLLKEQGVGKEFSSFYVPK